VLELGEQAVLVPDPVLPVYAATFAHLDFRGLANHAWYQRLGAVGSEVLLDLDRDDFGGVHLSVEKLDDATRLAGDLVGDEHHAELPGAQVLTGARPELLDVGLVACYVGYDGVGVPGIALALAEEDFAQLLERPVDDAVGRIVQHLPYDLPADPRVGAAFDLDDRRDRVLVQEQVIDRPASR
jgi:hypothetical protein